MELSTLKNSVPVWTVESKETFYVAHHVEWPDAQQDARYEARKHPEAVYIATIPNLDFTGVSWTYVITANAKEADAAIHRHLECEILDVESLNFTCYSCSTTIEWIG